MNHHFKILPIIAVVAFQASPSRAAEPLEAADREAITKLFDTFQADLRTGKPANYADYFDKTSLIKFVVQHRTFVNLMRKQLTDEQLAKFFIFTPDMDTVLQEPDPEKYLKGMTPGPALVAMSQTANIVTKVAAIGGDREKAFVVAEGQFNGELGTTEPYYSVWPAVLQDGKWKFDVTTNMVRDLRIRNKGLQQGGTTPPPSEDTGK
ncbi:hypothetical protein OKA05_25260 [Luteolibacter arcticus]|uniref:SnoaL-like domain-containing protein n=1 Tax=Luteolibacter arcticus TaxID=1581411 RepID=A0ABT3GR06_9BACT|nr:hypothetical protein [Luteolibacter arcticus]MCW1925893.1 hypothetical protein [Luteolibacter arcticus]